VLVDNKFHIFNQFGKLIASNIYLKEITKNGDIYCLTGYNEFGGAADIGTVPSNWAIIESRFFTKHEGDV
jgi:hypothetical protein